MSCFTAFLRRQRRETSSLLLVFLGSMGRRIIQEYGQSDQAEEEGRVGVLLTIKTTSSENLFEAKQQVVVDVRA